ncbi:MAG: polysaccharide deacetylase family protein [Spirochaetales bacterium]|nr:polysaccharide deacetylase family protein [Spirochaetales bacterium]
MKRHLVYHIVRKPFYRRFFVLGLYFLLCLIPGKGSDESNEGGGIPRNENIEVKVFGMVHLAYDDRFPAGGSVRIGPRYGIIADDGFFELKGLLPGEYRAEISYNNMTIMSVPFELYEGVNQFDARISKLIPEFMVKNAPDGMNPEEIFSPVPRNVFHHGNRNLKRVAITIDDGWIRDDEFLELFERYGIRCTVFIIGGRGVGNKNPDWIRKMDNLGFEVCTHTWSHTPITKLSNAALKEDLRKSQMVFTNITHKKYPFFRPPFGIYDERTLKVVAENGYYIIHWSNAVNDFIKGITVERQVDYVMQHLKNGDIILAHFGAYNTFKVLQIIIPEILDKGYEICPLSEVLEGCDCE